MGHKVKIRVTLNSGKVEKIGFTLDEGKIFRLNGEVPGMAILASLVGDPETTVCRMTIKGDALVVSRSTKGPELIVNEMTVEEIKIRKGDICKYANGTVEFLECPVWVEQEASTKFVSLDGSDATAVMQNPNKTKFISAASIHETPEAPAQQEQHQEEPVQENNSRAEEVSSAAASSNNSNSFEPAHSQIQAHDDATGLIMRSKITDPDRRRSARRLEEPSYSTLYTNGNTEVSNVKKELYKHIAISLVIIGVCGEVSSLIAFGFKYDFSPIPTPYSGMALMALFSALSYVFFGSNKLLGTNGRFEQYLRSFAWFSLYLVPYAFCFGFPKSVVIFASVLISIIWTGLFSLRYFGQIPKFIPASITAWIVIIVGGFHVMTSNMIPALHPQALREIASDQAVDGKDADAKAPAPTAPGAATDAAATATGQAPAEGAPAVATAPAAPAGPQVAQAAAPPSMPAAPLSTQELAQQATSLSLDPMAQERFFNAVKSGNLNMVESMVERRVIDPVFTLDHGSTALHYAASQGDIRMVAYLVSKKVNVDAQDSGGTTALMWAAYKHHPKVVAYLIKRKANLQIRREGGDRALEIARSNEDKEIVAMLKSAMIVRKTASVKPRKRRHS
jgi:uncharacterized protein